MSRLCGFLPELDTPEAIGEWIRQFLVIHPFVDGNGRTALVLYNWLLGTLDDPQKYPDYFGESA